MDWKGMLTLAVLAPVLALFGGAGLLFWSIGQSWDSRNTDAMIASFAVSCATGGTVVAILLALIVGIPLSVRLWDRIQDQRERQMYERAQHRMAGPQLPGPRGWNEETPPLIEAKPDQGSWQTGQNTPYDLWEDDVAPDRDRDEW